MKAINYSIISLAFLMIAGCDQTKSDEFIKNELVKRINDKPDSTICLSIYMEEKIFPIDIIDDKNHIDNNSDESHQRDIQRFNFFIDQGLIKKETINIYIEKEERIIQGNRYTLSDKGKTFAYNNYFCFGNIKINTIDKIEDIKSILSKDKDKTISYTYSITAIPDWVKEQTFYSFYSLPQNLEDISINGEAIYKSDSDRFELNNHFLIKPL